MITTMTFTSLPCCRRIRSHRTHHAIRSTHIQQPIILHMRRFDEFWFEFSNNKKKEDEI